MFNSVALEVVIGLIFIYLLYSLLATVLSEIVAANLGLRARNLKVAVNRMLTDEKEKKYHPDWYVRMFQWLWYRIRWTIGLLCIMRNPKNPVIDDFYNHPEIKYLGNEGFFKTPSVFRAVSFSKTLLQVITENKPVTSERIASRLEELHRLAQTDQERKRIMKNGTEEEKQAFSTLKPKYFDQETIEYIMNMWQEAGADVDRFKLQLETWFDRTMEHATEWYKRKIQGVLLFIGFFMAVVFNADSFVIISKLSNDKEARKHMVELATRYVEIHPEAGKAINPADTAYQARIDTLLAVKKELDKDIADAHQILGLGGWLPDSVPVLVDTIKKQAVYPENIEAAFFAYKYDELVDTIRARQCCDTLLSPNVAAPAGPLPAKVQARNTTIPADTSQKAKMPTAARDTAVAQPVVNTVIQPPVKKLYTYATFHLGEKFCYLFHLAWAHFFGFLLTAIAISLGAPFWFDLLNKLMRLRVSEKQSTDTPKNTEPAPAVQPVAVHVNTSQGGEAVG